MPKGDEPNVSTSEYWEAAYREKRDRWELGEAAPPIVRGLREVSAAMPIGRAIVLGAGRGHEARAAAALGWEVVGIDFAQSACDEAAKLTPPALASRVSWRVQDLFTLDRTDAGAFDLVIEHTSFCAIARPRRVEWMRVARSVFRPNGLLLGLFYAHNREGGPPFGTTETEIRAALAEAGFRIERAEVPSDSIERRRGEELLVLARASEA